MACTITSASALRARVAPASRVRARASAARTVATPVRASAERRAVEVSERSASRRAGALSASVAAAAAAPALPALAAVQETAQVRSPPPRSPPPSRSRPTGPALIHSRIPTPPRLTPSPVPSIPFSDYQVASNGPLESARLFIALATIALILFQGPKGDGVVNSLNENRVFGSASEAKSAVDYVTAGLIGGFIVLSAVLAAQN